tara:strand:- start:33252 stop:34307 length:1056 start_codon:yes stop_codon:yes gene_type:complete
MDDMRDDNAVLDSVKDYYGKVLKSSADLKTSVCCLNEALPLHVREALQDIHPEVLARFYGCGSPIPPALEGATVLDLGSGSGRDCYVLAKMVGPAGRVIGVDMTDEQLAIARKHLDWHAEKLGYANVEFRTGYIEDLATAGIADSSIDLVVSNCVLNLSPDKQRVFSEIFRVLKPGGELYFSDVFSDRRIPQCLAEDPVLLGECLGGALYTEDFRRMLNHVGCADSRVVVSGPLGINNSEIERMAGHIRFTSSTVRAFKLALEDRCEDYGQVATYLGSEQNNPHFFLLDDHHRFETGKPMLVCGNTADMIVGTRYAKHFKVSARGAHFGLFDCGPSPSGVAATDASSGACC